LIGSLYFKQDCERGLALEKNKVQKESFLIDTSFDNRLLQVEAQDPRLGLLPRDETIDLACPRWYEQSKPE
jgi:hypothetical protein